MLLFNGSLHTLDKDEDSFYATVYQSVLKECRESGMKTEEADLSSIEVPLFDPYDQTPPPSVEKMIEQFNSNELQIWFAPLYHGSIPGVMKNALDWLQLTSRNDLPYLTNKKIGLLCMADGAFAVQGINAMTTIAHSLRATVLPYSIPINKLEDEGKDPTLLQGKIQLLVQLLKDSK